MQNFIASWSVFNGFVQLRSTLEVFSFCTIMRPPTNRQVFASFWTKHCYNPLSTPVLSRFISARLFSVPKLKMKLKGLHFAYVAEIQEAVTDELEKVRNFRQLFRNCMTALKPVYVPTERILNKKGMGLPHVSSIFKKFNPKTFGPHRVFAATLHTGGLYSPNMNHSPSQLKQKFWAKKINKHIFQKLT